METRYDYDDNCIAVIGMAARFPEAETLEQFWQNLMEGKVCRQRVPDEALTLSGNGDLRDLPDYVPYRYSFSGYEMFDAEFFGMTAREASLTDPQHRLVLEYAVRAFENAGYVPRDSRGVRTGVFASADISYYLLTHLYPYFMKGAIDVGETFMGNDKDYLATRIAYKQNFTGPAMTVQSACSSSLASLHMAVLSILGGDCDRAVVSSSTVLVPDIGYVYSPGGLHSPDGICRPYDVDAQGAVFSNGAAAVLLKRFNQAREDGDTIWAVIRGSASGNDGGEKIGFVAPSAEGQIRTIKAALEFSGTDPADVAYIEGHGTGTALGDPIEVSALHSVYGVQTENPVVLGSLKGNIGHLDSTAGLGSFIKTCLCLYHKISPGTANFQRLNPAFGDIRPLSVSAQAAPLPRREGIPLLAAVSAFGFGGTNVHVILQEAPEERTRSSVIPCPQLLLVSSPYKELLASQCTRVHDCLAKEEARLDNAAFTLAAGRSHYRWRTMVLADSNAHAAEILKRDDLTVRETVDEKRGIAFLFPGQGNLHPRAGAVYAEYDALFRSRLEEVGSLIRDAGGPDIAKLMADCQKAPSRSEMLLARTDMAQPLLFALETAFAASLRARGIHPSCLVGHSLGEYSAAVTAGIFSLPDAARLVVRRSSLMQAAPAGKMLLVTLGRERLPDILGQAYGRIELSVINGPANCVLTGNDDDLAHCMHLVEAAGQRAFYLNTSHAFHSASMEAVLEPFREVLSEIPMSPPKIPLASNLTGRWGGPEMATPEYWVSHLRRPVEFEQCVRLVGQTTSLGLETGPGHVMRTLAVRPGTGFRVVAGLDSPGAYPDPDTPISELPRRSHLEVAGELWLQGGIIDWEAFYAGTGRKRCSMPEVLLRPERYWIDRPEGEAFSMSGASSLTLPVEKRDRVVSDNHVPPRTAIERALAEIWEELLFVSPIGIHDSFLELGGNSIHIIQIIRMAEAKGFRVTVKDVFEGKTVAGVAARVGDNGQETAGPVKIITPPRFQALWPAGASPAFQYAVFRLSSDFNANQAEKLAVILSRRHDSLGLRWQDNKVCLEGALTGDRVNAFVLDLRNDNAAKGAPLFNQTNPEACLASLPQLTPDVPWSLTLLPAGDNNAESLLLARFSCAITDEEGMAVLASDIGSFLEEKTLSDSAVTSWQRWLSIFPQMFLGVAANMEKGTAWLFKLPQPHSDDFAETGFPKRRYRIQDQHIASLLHEAAKACRIPVATVVLSGMLHFLSSTSLQQLVLKTWKDARKDLPSHDPLARAVGVVGFPLLIPLPAAQSDIEEAIPSTKTLLLEIANAGVGTMAGQDTGRSLRFVWRGSCQSFKSTDKHIIGRGIWPEPIPGPGELVLTTWLEGEIFCIEADGPEEAWEHSLPTEFGKILRQVAECGTEHERSSRFVPADFPGRGLRQIDIDRILAQVSFSPAKSVTTL